MPMIPLRTILLFPTRVLRTCLRPTSPQRGLTLATILTSCSRLRLVAAVSPPITVTHVGVAQVGKCSSTAAIGLMARIAVSLRLLWTAIRPVPARSLALACCISPPKGVWGIFSPPPTMLVEKSQLCCPAVPIGKKLFRGTGLGGSFSKAPQETKAYEKNWFPLRADCLCRKLQAGYPKRF